MNKRWLARGSSDRRSVLRVIENFRLELDETIHPDSAVPVYRLAGESWEPGLEYC